jgi:mannosyl-glycoprotein endo-beta-N-acetylglucosaminidase
MINFLKYITEKIHKLKKGSIIIWYDSIIKINGIIKYQNELNENNFDFFNVCDGFFFNIIINN